MERLGVPIAGPLPGAGAASLAVADQQGDPGSRSVQVVSVGHEEQEDGAGGCAVVGAPHGKTEYTCCWGRRGTDRDDPGMIFGFAGVVSGETDRSSERAMAWPWWRRTLGRRALHPGPGERRHPRCADARHGAGDTEDALGLRVEVVARRGRHASTCGSRCGLSAVVSAALRQDHCRRRGPAYRNEIVPANEADVITRENAARADGAAALGKAVGEAWSFLALRSRVSSSAGGVSVPAAPRGTSRTASRDSTSPCWTRAYPARWG